MAKILLIDDSSFQRKNMTKSLQELGYEVVTAENGEVGLEKIDSEQPDLILTDLLMPVMDGISFLKNLKESQNPPSAIVITADIQESTRKECLNMGARAFLNKPTKSNDLKDAINKVLGKPSKEISRC